MTSEKTDRDSLVAKALAAEKSHGQLDDLVDLYLTYDFPESEIIQDMLGDAGIGTYAHKLEPSAFPINVGKHGQIRIAVRAGHVDEAIDVIKQAIDDEIIDEDNGQFVH